MDRSFLSNAGLVAASRDWVCVRLATYEDAEEGKLLADIFRGRSGELENTVFVLLAPDGKERLSRAGRGPHMVFTGQGDFAVQQMVGVMNDYGVRYPPKSTRRELPLLADVRLAINVCSCDNQPLVITLAENAEQQKAMESRLATYAWSKEFIGHLQYVSTTNSKDLAKVSGAESKPGYLIVRPGKFGLTAKTIIQVPATASDQELHDALSWALVVYEPIDKDHRQHVMAGHEAGVNWKTAIPVTDPGIPPGGRGGSRRGPGR